MIKYIFNVTRKTFLLIYIVYVHEAIIWQNNLTNKSIHSVQNFLILLLRKNWLPVNNIITININNALIYT